MTQSVAYNKEYVVVLILGVILGHICYAFEDRHYSVYSIIYTKLSLFTTDCSQIFIESVKDISQEITWCDWAINNSLVYISLLTNTLTFIIPRDKLLKRFVRTYF